jgi:hypothetical protein
MGRYDDKDGIDAPFNLAWDAALHEDKLRADAKRNAARKCKHCRREHFMLTDRERVEDHAKLLALVTGHIAWACPSEQSLLNHASSPYVIGSVHHLIARLVAADQGLCVHCVDYIEGPAS